MVFDNEEQVIDKIRGVAKVPDWVQASRTAHKELKISQRFLLRNLRK